jgi:hypothetical protein
MVASFARVSVVMDWVGRANDAFALSTKVFADIFKEI